MLKFFCMKIDSFKRFALDNKISEALIKKGLDLSDKIDVLSFNSIRVVAIVTEGTNKYKASLTFGKDGLIKDSFCTCKLGRNCQHVVALKIYEDGLSRYQIEEFLRTYLPEEAELHGNSISQKNDKIIDSIIIKARNFFKNNNGYYTNYSAEGAFFDQKIIPVYEKLNKEERKYLLIPLFLCFQNTNVYRPTELENIFKGKMRKLINMSSFSSAEIYDLIKAVLDNKEQDKISYFRLSSIFALYNKDPFETPIKNAFLDSQSAFSKDKITMILDDYDTRQVLLPDEFTPKRFIDYILKTAVEEKSEFNYLFFGDFLNRCMEFYPDDISVFESLLEISCHDKDSIYFKDLLELLDILKDHPGISNEKWDKIIYSFSYKIQNCTDYLALRQYMSKEVIDRILKNLHSDDKCYKFIYLYETSQIPEDLTANSLSFEELASLGDKIPEKLKSKEIKRVIKRIEKLLTYVNPNDDFGNGLLFLDKVSPKTVKGYLSLPNMLKEALRSPFNAYVFLNLADKYEMMEALGFHKYGGK